MDVSKNMGTPKWMVFIMENPIKMDDLGGPTPILGNYPYGQKNMWRHIFDAVQVDLECFLNP